MLICSTTINISAPLKFKDSFCDSTHGWDQIKKMKKGLIKSKALHEIFTIVNKTVPAILVEQMQMLYAYLLGNI
jgi:hypothetical protein